MKNFNLKEVRNPAKSDTNVLGKNVAI
ncbi:unknown protein [Parachlamydia acanthamoebae UV-7]|uniref:Uncharacterized protein n=1 Tax=Parachlamydia acanthamoebae (strain UV7) TaxID=765952 RepID=F8KZD9_PARAV|nr:unknown protein [Parachlamydia acanthamoebae UV-7]